MLVLEINLRNIDVKNAYDSVSEHALVHDPDLKQLLLYLLACHSNLLEEEMLTPILLGITLDWTIKGF